MNENTKPDMKEVSLIPHAVRGELMLDTVTYNGITEILANARQKAYSAVNFATVEAYWLIGKKNVELQDGNERAEYGAQLLRELSKRLTHDFGRGFDESNLRYIRLFYLAFPIRDALRHELSWTHYKLILRVENEKARQFYIEEAVKSQWSTRQLERQILTCFYERLLPTEEELKKEIETEMRRNQGGL
jgi:hypothetical protein